MWKISKYSLFIFAIAILLSACKSQEQAFRILLDKKEKEERIAALLQQTISYETLSGSIRINIKPGSGNKNTSTSGHLKIKKNEAIEISMRDPIIGMTEVARISITPNQILIIDRFNKQYFVESMERIREVSPFEFDYYSIQALFTNQLFIAGKSDIQINDFQSFSLKEDEFQALLKNKDSYGVNYDFTSDYTNRILKTEIYKEKSKATMVWDYLEFGLASNNRLFPMRMQMDFLLPDDVFSMGVQFNKVNINERFVIETTIPAKYKQISLEQVMQMIKSL